MIRRPAYTLARRGAPYAGMGALAYEYGPSIYRAGKGYGAHYVRRGYKHASDWYNAKEQGQAVVSSNKRTKRGRAAHRIPIRSALELSKKQKSQKSKIDLLTKLAKASLGTMRYRRFEAFRQLAGVNVQSIGVYGGSTVSLMEAAIVNLKYYDPSTPATLLTADASSGAFQKEILFKRQSSQIKMRNNYAVDCEVTVYLCKPKEDTSIEPNTAWSNGCTDGSNTANTVLGQFPTDYPQFRDIFSSKRMIKKQLSPGQEIICKHSESDCSYDPSITDSHALTYQKRNKAFAFMVVLRGILSHDVNLDEQGVSAAGLDIEQTHSYLINYDAGIDLEFTYLSSSTDTPTSGFVASNKPLSGQQSYSL